MDITEAVQHLPEISRTTFDVLARIMSVAHAKLPSRCRHQLCKSGGTSRTDGHWVEPGLGPDKCQHQSMRKPVSNLCFSDQWLV